MPKVILVTGATDGIGHAVAIRLKAAGHRLLLHGRNADKLGAIQRELSGISSDVPVETCLADLSRRDQVDAMVDTITAAHKRLDGVINNAGVFKATPPVTPEGLDMCFVVNAIAPYLITRRLLPRLGAGSRVVNVSSAAQAPVHLNALAGRASVADTFAAYAQSKLALTMWTRAMAKSVGSAGPMMVAVNPGSMLGTKMVREGFGVPGSDLQVGAEIVVRAMLSDAFSNAGGRYFDNDVGRFAEPHPDARDRQKCKVLVKAIEDTLLRWH